MSQETFRALVLTEEEGAVKHAIRELTNADLPEGEVLVDVDYSSLNYKDGLAVSGKGRIVRRYPMVPGIDFAGTVIESASAEWKPGDRVVLTGWGVGERYWGGYSQRARVKGEWLVPLPEGLDSRRAMAIGTAGFTAMLCVMTLEDAGVRPESGTVLVTGAAGGVGSVAVAVLAQLGYRVAAVTGRESAHGYLHGLGAKEVVPREELSEPGRPLETQRWAGAVDTVGGDMLARVLTEVNYGGAVAACGLAGGAKLNTTVMPFILRGVSLRGVDSVMCPRPRREAAWRRLLTDLPAEMLEEVSRVVPLAEVPELAREILVGQVRGRVVVDVNA